MSYTQSDQPCNTQCHVGSASQASLPPPAAFPSPPAEKAARGIDRLERELGVGGGVGPTTTTSSDQNRKVAIWTTAGIGTAATVIAATWYWDKKGRPSGKDIAKGITDTAKGIQGNIKAAGAWVGRHVPVTAR